MSDARSFGEERTMSDYVAYLSGTPEKDTWHLEEDGELAWEYLTKEALLVRISEIMDPGDTFTWEAEEKIEEGRQ
jgi:hypothetical protein